jgi:hypothetical protein
MFARLWVTHRTRRHRNQFTLTNYAVEKTKKHAAELAPQPNKLPLFHRMEERAGERRRVVLQTYG